MKIRFFSKAVMLCLVVAGFSAVHAQINVQVNTGAVAAVMDDPTIQKEFETNFLPNTLRVDYYIAGDAKTESVYLDEIKIEPNYGGPHKDLVDPLNYGTYRYAAYDSASGRLIFSRGFCNLFQEWQHTSEALKVKRSFEQVAVMPFPRQTIRFQVERRKYEDGKFSKLFELYINPNDYFIEHKKISAYPVVKFHDSGDPEKKVDVAFIAEGYTKEEMDKFLKDAQRIGEYFLTQEPYASSRDRLNFYAVEAPSAESGVTDPGRKTYVNTDLNSSFYTFDMDRYLTTSNTKAIYDIAAAVPYDVIFILVNSKLYGGGGFYNHYGESTVDHSLSPIVSVHEFGHTFAGLADEYYTSEITYKDFYNLKVEPWEPNITTKVGFDTKWKNMIGPGIPMPTPREEKYKNVVGMFEGGGYEAKGVFSPVMDCRMKSNEAEGFCPVCREAIIRMIRFYCEE
ncbi:MAG: M64 family metallo-endopeptidase [Bacteroidetes bacterium]|nr:M64 family metallo-endopeptidase [Bacteroidota bacterium]